MNDSDKPLRVLLWSAGGSGEHYNGPASFTYRLFGAAPPKALSLDLVHGSEQQKTYALFRNQHFLHSFPYAPALSERLNYTVKGYQWVAKEFANYDIFHGVSAYEYNLVPAVKAEALGVPAVVFMSSQNSELSTATFRKKVSGVASIRKALLAKVSAVVAMSNAINDELLDSGIAEENIARIPMGVDTELFSPVRGPSHKKLLRTKLHLEESPTVVFSGTLVKRKRPDLLIEALGILKKEGVECQLVFAGPESDAVYAASMRKRADELGVSNRIKWLGFVNNIVEIYQAADIFCLPSTSEGMAAALVEAMSCGLAPIVTKISGSEDLVTHASNGCIVKQCPKELAACIGEYTSSSNLLVEHARRSRILVEERYSHAVVYDAYHQLYLRLLSGGTAAC